MVVDEKTTPLSPGNANTVRCSTKITEVYMKNVEISTTVPFPQGKLDVPP